PTPFFAESKDRLKVYENRVEKKSWDLIWYKVNISTKN
ncbi:hypothetical protein V7149_07535, partial [Bacillus sp. JJ1503]